MFGCSRCASRTLRALIHDAPPQVQGAMRPFLAATVRSTRQRRTAVSLSEQQIRADDKSLPFDAATRKLGISPVPKRHLELELKILPDKFALAEHVQKMLLNKEQFDKALALVRLASSQARYGQCTVAWNHLIRYELGKGHFERAWNLFNDMKKREQFPDSHTFIAIFKGLANRSQYENGVPTQKQVTRVVDIYKSMYAENARCEPSVIHANAALQMCSMGGDIDSIWEIVSKLDEQGGNSPDGITFTVLLNAIRSTTIKAISQDPNSRESAVTKAKAVAEGIEVWEDVVRKWRSGQVVVDEKLVVAMAQLLLLSPRLQDWNSVFDLFRQSMNIARVPSLDAQRKLDHIPQPKLDEEDIAAPDTAFDQITDAAQKKSKKTAMFSWVRPGPATLSMLIEASLMARVPKAAREYWDVLTADPFNVRPDLVNLERYLKLCSINRSSRLIAENLPAMLQRHEIIPRKETLNLAMTACLRDRSNPHAVENAGKIMQLLTSYSNEPDVTLLMQYFQLALESSSADNIATAVLALSGPAKTWTQIATQGSANAVTRSAWKETLSDVTALFQGMTGALDTLLKNKLTSNEQNRLLEAQRVELTRAIGLVKDRLKALGVEQTAGTRRMVVGEKTIASKATRDETRMDWTVNKQFNALSRWQERIKNPTKVQRDSRRSDRNNIDRGLAKMTRRSRSPAARETGTRRLSLH